MTLISICSRRGYNLPLKAYTFIAGLVSVPYLRQAELRVSKGRTLRYAASRHPLYCKCQILRLSGLLCCDIFFPIMCVKCVWDQHSIQPCLWLFSDEIFGQATDKSHKAVMWLNGVTHNTIRAVFVVPFISGFLVLRWLNTVKRCLNVNLFSDPAVLTWLFALLD